MVKMHCDACKTRYDLGEHFCAICGSPLVGITVKESGFWETWRVPLMITAGVLCFGILMFVEILKTDNRPTNIMQNRPEATPKVEKKGPVSNAERPSLSPTIAQPSISTENASAKALVTFRSKLMNLPDARLLILSVQGTPVPGVARVQVSNAWYDFRPHERRQLTQMMANLWSSEMKGETAILHVYDITGQEIAGTRVFGGVWTDDE